MYNPFALKEKTILVTGASGGIGRQIAINCSKLGANVVITGRNAEQLKKTFNLLEGGGNHLFIICDFTNDEDISAFVNNCPILDGLSNNIGVNKTSFIKHLNTKIIEDLLRINTTSQIILIQLLIKNKKFNKNSSIVFTSSLSGIYSVHYGDSLNAICKGAINAFSKSAALDFASQNIRVNCVNPGIIITDSTYNNSILSEDEMNEKQKYFPLKRFGIPDDVANATIFLLSDASSWITGINLPIDGGYSLI